MKCHRHHTPPKQRETRFKHFGCRTNEVTGKIMIFKSDVIERMLGGGDRKFNPTRNGNTRIY